MHRDRGNTVFWAWFQLCALIALVIVIVVMIMSELSILIVVSPGRMRRRRSPRNIIERERSETQVCSALVVLGDRTVEIGREPGRFSAVSIVRER